MPGSVDLATSNDIIQGNSKEQCKATTRIQCFVLEFHRGIQRFIAGINISLYRIYFKIQLYDIGSSSSSCFVPDYSNQTVQNFDKLNNKLPLYVLICIYNAYKKSCNTGYSFSIAVSPLHFQKRRIILHTLFERNL